VFNVTVHMIATLFERSSRTNFVHHMLREQLQTVVAQAKSEQEEATELVYNKQKAYQKVVAATAHDLRTTSSAIQSGCRVLNGIVDEAEKRGDPCKLVPQQRSVLESMSAMAKFSTMFLEGMTRSAHLLEGSSVPIFMGKIDIQQVIDESIACGKSACSATGAVEHMTEVGPGVQQFIYSDLNCISRNLINLISNAAKHTVKGSIAIKVSLQASQLSIVSPQPVFVEIAVRDTGVADENKSLIFEPFVSMDESTGLGLFVVQMQSEALGGSCGVRDNPEARGAEFWFRVPYVTTEQELQEYNDKCVPKVHELMAASSSDVAVELRPGGIAVFQEPNHDIQVAKMASIDAGKMPGTILLIDDNLSLLDLHAAELTSLGYKVATALGGTQGLASLKMKPYSLVLIDIKMPVINGDEVVAAFRHWEGNNRTGKPQMIYALSAYTSEDVQKRCAHVGMAGVVSKPIRIGIILELINTAMESM